MAKQPSVPSLPTLKDVAELAEVSRTTASMALSGRTGSAHISAACIKRVQKAAKTLGYRGNYHARTLFTGRSLTLGMATGTGPVSVIGHTFFSPICGGIESSARQRGYDVLTIGGTELLEPLDRALHHLEAKRIDALIVIRALYHQLTPELTQSHLPIVLLDSEPSPLPRVHFNSDPGIIQAIEHLAALGHRRVAYITPQDSVGYIARRMACFSATTTALGIGCDVLMLPDSPGDPPDEGSWMQRYHHALSSMKLPDGCTAVMCFNDTIACALYAVLSERGLRVPKDVSVIGFDGYHSEKVVPELTSISHAQVELGRACVSLALDLYEGRIVRTPAPVLKVPSYLIIRHSTGPARV